MKPCIMKILEDLCADGCEESASNTKSEPFKKNNDNALQSSWWDCGRCVRTEVEDTISMILWIKKFRSALCTVR